MSRSLYAGASGLLAHQRKLDVVANNLANLNTTGFKASRILFSDLLYQKVVNEANPIGDTFGGRNPAQLGNGVKVSQITRRFEQGTLQSTGEQYDMAIVGNGFFTVSDGSRNFFTRDGSFTVNRDGYLTTASGLLVQRTGTLGEPSEGVVGYQVPGASTIKIPLGKATKGAVTKNASFTGNLPSSATGPRIQVATSNAPLLEGGSAATLSTLLNDLDSNSTDYVSGDQIRIAGSGADGTPFSVDINVDGSTTLGDLINAINAAITGATASLDSSGNIVLTDNAEGTSQTRLVISDVTGNTGQTDWLSHDMLTTVEGKFGDTFTTTIQIFDEQGQTHDLVVTFQKMTNRTWDATFSISGSGDSMLDNRVSGIEFNDDGSFRRITGSGTGDSRITIDYEILSSNQTIQLDFRDMSHNPGNFTSFIEQDGFPRGVLFSFAVSPDGVLEAIATNGVRVPLAQLAIASFRNEQALSAVGNNMFEDTIASGAAQIGPGMTSGRGQILNGNLEQSNVDIAFEFTQLIVAQRGFSANARTITVTDGVLQELINIVR